MQMMYIYMTCSAHRMVKRDT